MFSKGARCLEFEKGIKASRTAKSQDVTCHGNSCGGPSSACKDDFSGCCRCTCTAIGHTGCTVRGVRGVLPSTGARRSGTGLRTFVNRTGVLEKVTCFHLVSV